MVWNKDLPSGSKQGNLLDNDSRTNNAALETAIDAEHDFTTGGTQTGRHTFMVDGTATIAAVTAFGAGALAFADDETGYSEIVPYFYDGSDWWYGLTEETLTIANSWTAPQAFTSIHCSTDDLTSGANIASDLEDTNVFYVDLANSGQLDNPDNTPGADKGGVWFYVVQQDAGGPWQLTYDTDFVGAPVLSATEDDIDVLMAVHDDAENIHLFNLTRGTHTPATDAEALTGTAEDKVVTPNNLGQAHLTTWDKGYYKIIGTGADGTGLVEQWVVITNPTSPTESIAFEKEFASANYCISLAVADSSVCDIRVETGTIVATGFDCTLSENAAFLYVRAIGIIKA